VRGQSLHGAAPSPPGPLSPKGRGENYFFSPNSFTTARRNGLDVGDDCRRSGALPRSANLVTVAGLMSTHAHPHPRRQQVCRWRSSAAPWLP